MMLRFIFIILISFSCFHSQNLPTPEQVLGKQEKPKTKKPKFDPNGDWHTVTMDFDTKKKRVEYMKKNMALYCLEEPVYASAYESIIYGSEMAVVDTSDATSCILLTVKMSDNSVFVFLIHNLCTFKLENTGYVNVTFFNFKYGEVDAASIKSFVTKKKRLYPNNNTFTEELTLGKMKFTIEDKTTPTTLLFSGKTIELMPLNISKYSSGNGGK